MFILRPSNPEGSPRRTLSANTPSERTREGQHATCFKEHFEGLHVLDVLCTLTRLCQLENYAGRSTVTPHSPDKETEALARGHSSVDLGPEDRRDGSTSGTTG